MSSIDPEMDPAMLLGGLMAILNHCASPVQKLEMELNKDPKNLGLQALIREMKGEKNVVETMEFEQQQWMRKGPFLPRFLQDRSGHLVDSWPALHALGIQVLEEYDELFYYVSMPPYWRIQAAEECAAVSYLLDQRGGQLMRVVYFGAHYKRAAHLEVTPAEPAQPSVPAKPKAEPGPGADCYGCPFCGAEPRMFAVVHGGDGDEHIELQLIPGSLNEWQPYPRTSASLFICHVLRCVNPHCTCTPPPSLEGQHDESPTQLMRRWNGTLADHMIE